MFKIKAGDLLIAEPFLKDPNFMRTVIFLCEHTTEGSFGLVINKQLNINLSDVFEISKQTTKEIYYGGPVNMDTIHFLHQLPKQIPNSIEVTNGIYWGGDFEVVLDLITTKKIDLKKIQFYLGYSGWNQGQLQKEMVETESWLVTPANTQLVFNTSLNNIWKASIGNLGAKYAPLQNYPTDPQLN